MKSFRTAAITLAGIELAHRIRKRQFSFGSRGPHELPSLKHAWARALTSGDNATAGSQSIRGANVRDCTRTQQASVC
jgi:hypothetical protein